MAGSWPNHSALLARQLYGVESHDPVILGLTAIVLAASALAGGGICACSLRGFD